MAFDPFTLAGMVGTALMVAAYFATQQGRLTAKDWRYPLANLVGAILILVSLVSAWNLPVVLNTPASLLLPNTRRRVR
jgi:hypothetical protein